MLSARMVGFIDFLVIMLSSLLHVVYQSSCITPGIELDSLCLFIMFSSAYFTKLEAVWRLYHVDLISENHEPLYTMYSYL